MVLIGRMPLGSREFPIAEPMPAPIPAQISNTNNPPQVGSDALEVLAEAVIPMQPASPIMEPIPAPIQAYLGLLACAFSHVRQRGTKMVLFFHSVRVPDLPYW